MPFQDEYSQPAATRIEYRGAVIWSIFRKVVFDNRLLVGGSLKDVREPGNMSARASSSSPISLHLPSTAIK